MNSTQPTRPAALAPDIAIRGHAGSGPDCQVLVVGAGPTGLVLGAELLARGIQTRIIDKGDGMALESRAIGIHARTLEILDMMGLAERLTERGQVVRHLRFYSTFAGNCGEQAPTLEEIQQMTDNGRHGRSPYPIRPGR